MNGRHEKYPRPLLTIHEVADVIGVHESTVRRWINEGALRAFKFRRVVRVPAEEVENLCTASHGESATREDPAKSGR